MVQDPSAAGGGAIYKDGNAVNISLGASESTTVPAGETWVVTASVEFQSTGYDLLVNGQTAYSGDGFTTTELVVSDGDTVGTDSNVIAHLSGWSV